VCIVRSRRVQRLRVRWPHARDRMTRSHRWAWHARGPEVAAERRNSRPLWVVFGAFRFAFGACWGDFKRGEFSWANLGADWASWGPYFTLSGGQIRLGVEEGRAAGLRAWAAKRSAARSFVTHLVAPLRVAPDEWRPTIFGRRAGAPRGLKLDAARLAVAGELGCLRALLASSLGRETVARRVDKWDKCAPTTKARAAGALELATGRHNGAFVMQNLANNGRPFARNSSSRRPTV